VNGQARSNRIPTKSWILWVSLVLLSVAVGGLTMWKDWWLTGSEPNALFYLFVPPLSITGGVLSAFGIARAAKQPLALSETLAVVLSVNIIMQLGEIVLKVLYYRMWQYPGILYLLIVFPLALVLSVYGFTRWAGLKWWMALIVTVVELAGEMIVGMLLTSIGGLSTPGS
jgi:hypothetical protein